MSAQREHDLALLAQGWRALAGLQALNVLLDEAADRATRLADGIRCRIYDAALAENIAACEAVEAGMAHLACALVSPELAAEAAALAAQP